MSHILLVEDEEHLATGIKFNLEAEGYDVTHAADGQAALSRVENVPPVDLVILDLMLPGMSGYSVCEAIRESGFEMPVLMLSARTLAEDRTRGFDVGADQYLTKPFELDELLSRVHRLLSVSGGRNTRRATTFRFANVTIVIDKLKIVVDDETHKITALEMKLMDYFVKNEGRVISRRELLEKVWERTGSLATRAPDQFVRRLRKIIEPNPSEPMYLLTIRDAGYLFTSTGDV